MLKPENLWLRLSPKKVEKRLIGQLHPNPRKLRCKSNGDHKSNPSPRLLLPMSRSDFTWKDIDIERI